MSPFLPEWVLAHADRTPGAPAVATPRLRLTYGELGARLRGLAAHLAAAGVRAGDRVLLALPASPAAVAAALAVQALGATALEVDPSWGEDVLGDVVARAGVRQAFVAIARAARWARIRAAHPLERLWVVGGAAGGPDPGGPVTRVAEDGRVDAAGGEPPPPRWPTLSPDSPALVLFTSGSTGRPRGVVQTFRNLHANTRSIVEYLALGPEDRALLVLPLHYCYGRSVLQTHLYVGGSVLLDDRSAYPRVVLDALGTEGCTGFAGVPLTYEILRRQVDVAGRSLPRLRYLTQAGGAMAPETVDWVREAFRPAELYVMYGQTEATARLAYLPPARAREKRGAIGIAIPGVELRVVDEAGRELAPGEVGQLVARGENVTPGYLDDPEATAAILRDGWLWTGDLASSDAEGFLFHRGRARELLKIAGRRVSPVEIEHVIAEHPDVAEVAVVGAHDPLRGEVPVAFFVPRAGRAPLEDALRAFCRGRMAAWRVPVRFSPMPALPRSAAGKLLRAELAAAAAAAPRLPGR